VLKATLTGTPLLCSVTRDSKKGTVFIKYVNAQATPQSVTIALKGIRSVKSDATEIVLAADPKETNAIDNPEDVLPITRKISGIQPTFTHQFAPNSVTILRLDAQ